MEYKNTVKAEFIERLNRFTAVVNLNGKTETVHVKNTGRCRELLLPGAEVILAPGNNKKRKTAYDLITVRKRGLGWVNIDSQAPNAVTEEWLKSENSKPEDLEELSLIRPEFNFGASRIDFYLENGKNRILMEVKGCTLEKDGTGYFPDAPTERGVKHLKELTRAAAEGYKCYLAFVIAMPGIFYVRPNVETHPEFGTALEEAVRAGIKILYLSCNIKENRIDIHSWKVGPDIKKKDFQ